MADINNAHAQLSYESAVYREQLRLLQKEIERINLATIDLSNALSTAERIAAQEVLVPVGGGAFVKASVANTSILVPIGANYLAEMEKDKAVAELKKRMDSTRSAIEKLNEEFQKVSVRLREINFKLREVQTQAAISKRVDENIGEDYL